MTCDKILKKPSSPKFMSHIHLSQHHNTFKFYFCLKYIENSTQHHYLILEQPRPLLSYLVILKTTNLPISTNRGTLSALISNKYNMIPITQSSMFHPKTSAKECMQIGAPRTNNQKPNQIANKKSHPYNFIHFAWNKPQPSAITDPS